MTEEFLGKKFSGKTVYNGITMGKVLVLRKDQEQIRRTKVENPEQEIKRVQDAVDTSKQQLAMLYDKAVKEVGASSAAIFEVHQMMLEDEDYLDAVYHVIRTEMVNAEYAVAVTGDNFAGMFVGMDDEYMQARAADIKDISARLVQNLSGQGGVDFSAMEPSIIVAEDLSPSETVQMDKKENIGICDSTWLYKFAHGHSCPHDEYSSIDWCTNGFKRNSNRNDCGCGWSRR